MSDTCKSGIYKLQAYENPAAALGNAVAPAKSDYNTSLSFHNLRLPNPIPSHLPNDIRRASQSQSSDAKIIVWDFTKPGNANKRKNHFSEPQRPPKRNSQRWIAAGSRVVDNIKMVKFSIESFLSQRFDLLVQGSLDDRRSILATRVGSNRGNQSNTADTIVARTELFFFFSTLWVLEKGKALSMDDCIKWMDCSESRTGDFRHRRATISGVAWFHEKIIFELCKKGWKIEHAIAIVALISPDVASQYEHIRHKDNVKIILDKLQHLKDYSEHTEYIGKLLFEYVRLWDPSMGGNKTLYCLYPGLRPSKPLLSILYALAQEGFVDCSLLTYASTKRKRWTASGELEDFSIGEIGFEDTVSDTVCDTKKLEHELCILRSQGLIEWSDGRIRIDHEYVIEWPHWMQASLLLCFYFTGCEYSDKFSAVGYLALPSFQRFLQAYKQQPEYRRQALRKLVLPAIVQASKFSDLAWKKECICTLNSDDLQATDDYTQASFVVRKAYVLRSDGEWDKSSEVIKKQLRLMEDKLDPRLNAVRGLLINSLATNLWEKDRFDEASAIWKKWRPPTHSNMSLFETRVSTRILMCTGKAMLHQGDFGSAKSSLESAMEQYNKDIHPHLDVLATLSDVYCELRDASRAQRLLEPVIERNKDLTNRYIRNCYISYAESLILTRCYKEAEELLINLKNYFEKIPQLDRHDQRRKIRVMLQLAQNHHRQAVNLEQWNGTLERWGRVIASMNQFDEVSNWDLGVICMSMHHATLRAGINDSQWFKKGTKELENPGRFGMRGVGTYWREYISLQLPPPVVTTA